MENISSTPFLIPLALLFFTEKTTELTTFHFSRFVIETPKGVDPKGSSNSKEETAHIIEVMSTIIRNPLSFSIFCRLT